MDYRQSVASITEAVAVMLRNGQDFYSAFDEAFSVSNFLHSEKENVIKEVGGNLNWRRQKKRMHQSRPLIARPNTTPKSNRVPSAQMDLIPDLHVGYSRRD